MSTVLLMTDSWQPTVLRLVPFSKNNARSLTPTVQRVQSNSQNQRGFPVLAVTRSPRKHSSSSGYRSVTPRSVPSALSDNIGERDDVSMISDSNVTWSTGRTEVSTKSISKSRYAKKKIPEVHAEMKEAIKFSVQDLNDQASTISSIQSADSKGESQDTKNNKTINTRTKLPRPSMVAQNEIPKGFTPAMGVHKFVTLTPGELELQKYKDNYAQEQAQKKKKYKMNVNQLPRSTTPINDHDPDKLNMKQVIAFLQTKGGNVPQKKISFETKRDIDTSRSQAYSERGYMDIKSSPGLHKVASVESVALQSSNIQNPDFRHVDRTGNTRLDNPGCVSVLSTKSTPNLPYRSGRQSVKSNVSSSTSKTSMRSHKDRSHRHSEKSKQKEFRLYRFLAIAPDAPIAANNCIDIDQVPVIQRVSYKYSSPREKMRFIGNAAPMTSNDPMKTRHQTTANLIHRRAATKNVTNPGTEEKESESPEKPIRLPLVTDAEAESADEECETCSTTSATCNSAERTSKDEERRHYPKKGKVISFSDELHEESRLKDCKLAHKDKNDCLKNVQGFLEQSTNQDEIPKMVPINSPRQIHVTMPHAHTAKYSQEIVRLTLRQAKNATRVTSYMSDIESDFPFKPEDWRYQSAEDVENYSSSGLTQLKHPESKEWVEHSRQFVNNVSSNNFIKVRQKLKASNISNVE